MRRHAKASSAGSNEGNGKSRGLFGRAFAIRGASSDSKGSGAPKAKLALALGGALILILALGVSLAAAVIPTLTIEDAKEVSYTSALAKGTVDPQGKETNCHFEYISQAQLDENVGNGFGEFEFAGGADCNGNPHEGTGAQSVEASLNGLAPSTVYHLRLVASNEDGQSEAVAADTFETKAVAKPIVTIDPVATFTGTTAHFTGSINPNAPGGEPAGKPDAFDVSWHFQCTPDCPGLEGSLQAGTTAQGVTADATGLEPNTHYDVTLVASNAGGQESAGPVSFTTEAVGPSATTIPAFVLEGGQSALVGGKVNAHNSASTYWVEYGTDTGYGSSAPLSKDAAAGSSGQDKFVTQEISGLALDTTYHYRLVAKNPKGESQGEDMTFKTPVPAGPPASCPNAALRTGPSAGLPDCRAYEDVTSLDLLGSSARTMVTHASLTAADGEAVLWRDNDVAPGIDSTGNSDSFLSKRTAGGWTSSLASPPGSKAPSAAGPMYATPNLDRIIWLTYGATIDPADQDPLTPQNANAFNDLYRREPDGSFVWLTRGSFMPPVTKEDRPIYGGSSADGLKVFFGSIRQLEPDAPGGGLYERVGQTTTVIRNQDGNPAVVGSVQAVSADGSVVALRYFSDLLLYRESLGYVKPLASNANLVSLSADGTRLFLATAAPLTADDTDSATDIYEYEIGTETFRRISAPTGAPAGPGPGNGGANAEPVAEAVEGSSDGSTLYFTSTEQLDGSKGTSGVPNLYIYRNGVTRFAAPLDAAYSTAEAAPDGSTLLRVTPDGSLLLLKSDARLTSYDNDGHTEIYAYYADSGVLSCVSCRPSGEQPTGDATLDGGERVHNYLTLFTPPNYAEDGGRIFFSSSDAIAPQDINGKYDVYEFDASSGTNSLISTGQSPVDSAYYGSSTDGRDVFFFSLDSLTPHDRNVGAFKIYDARIGGGFPEVVPPAPCEGESCRSSNSGSPPPSAPATPNFIGPGNPKPKPKHAKKHKAKKHKKQQSKSHKRDANANGRTGR